MFEHPTKDGDEMMQILVFAWSSRASVCNLSVVGLIIIVYFRGNLRKIRRFSRVEVLAALESRLGEQRSQLDRWRKCAFNGVLARSLEDVIIPQQRAAPSYVPRYSSTIMVPSITQLLLKKLALSLDWGPNLSA